MGRLSGKIAIVTGGNSGIGLAAAKEFVAEGAQVIITGRRDETNQDALKEIGEGAIAFRGDMAQLEDLDRLVAEVKQRFGRIDVYFANAGTNIKTPIGSATVDTYDAVFDVNFKAVFFGVQKALPIMPDGASIVLCGSMASFKGLPAHDLYSASKAAVRSLARSWTVDLKARNIRVNVLSPGPIETPLGDKIGLNEEQLAAAKAGLAAQVPMGRMGLPIEVARAAVFLASDDSSYVTGMDLCVDGGMGQV